MTTETRAPGASVGGIVAAEVRLARGTLVGRYIVLGPLGEGGMSIVVEAYDPELDRKVAIKVLRPGLSFDDRHQERLVREAHALARLSHAGVIQVYDVGTFDGRLFIALELLDGGTLRDWLRAGPRPWREIRDLFLRAGRGLEAAHAAGLVHRDFKPMNVLLGKDGRVRVTDFGLVRVAGEDGPASGVEPVSPLALDLTRTGMALGTPAYMAPEQHEGGTVDAASDQFGYCASLWEALTGARPFAGTTREEIAAAAAAGRLVAAPASVAAPAWLLRVLRRGLEPERAARFPSMTALLAAVERDPGARWRRLAGLALLAGAAATAAWFVRDRAVAVEPCAGGEARLAGVWDDARRQAVHAAFAATGAPFAEDTWRATSAALDAWAAGFGAMHRGACLATRRGEQSPALLDRRMACLDRRRDEAGALVTELVTADRDVLARSVEAVAALAPLAPCADATALFAVTPPPASQAARVAAIRARVDQARALDRVGKVRPALVSASIAAAEAGALGYRPLEAEAWLQLGLVEAQGTGRARGEPSFTAAVLTAIEAGDDRTVARAWVELVRVLGVDHQRFTDAERMARYADAAVRRLGPDLRLQAKLLYHRGAILNRRFRLDEALALSREALAILERVAGPDDLDTATTRGLVGSSLMARGRFAEAETELRRALAVQVAVLGPRAPRVATTRSMLAHDLAKAGNREPALQEARLAVAIVEEGLGPDARETAASLVTLALVLAQGTDYAEARVHLERALAINEKALGPTHLELCSVLSNLSETYGHLDLVPQAEAALRRAIAIRREVNGDDDPILVTFHSNLAAILHNHGRRAEALVELDDALARAVRLYPPDHPSLGTIFSNHGDALVIAGRLDEAERDYARALAIWERALGPKHPSLAYSLVGLGDLHLRRGDAAGALPLLERALALREAAPRGRTEVPEVQLAVARALGELRREPGRALALATRARDGYRVAGQQGQPGLTDAEAWLRKHGRAR